MSYVTNVVVAARHLTRDDLNWLINHWPPLPLGLIDDSQAGGTKVPEIDVYVAAYNHWDWGPKWEEICDRPWSGSSQFVLTILDEQGHPWVFIHGENHPYGGWGDDEPDYSVDARGSRIEILPSRKESHA